VPVADEVWRLHHREGRDCDLFRVIAEQGHYAGRTVPSDTRQGIYAAAPSGVLLGSINTRDARRVARMLRDALANWEALPEERRWLADLDDATPTGGDDWAKSQPAESLVLSVVSRDLDGDEAEEDWRSHAYNLDAAWFRPGELDSFVPGHEVGDAGMVDDELVARLARLHLLDNVRGQTPPFEREEVVIARLATRVTAVDGRFVHIEYSGATRTEQQGDWSIGNFHDAKKPTPQRRSVDLVLRGEARYDRDARRFVAFDVVARGTREGGTQFNARGDDLDAEPIGFLITLAPADERVAPAAFWCYPRR
jgi:hypothetical protein